MVWLTQLRLIAMPDGFRLRLSNISRHRLLRCGQNGAGLGPHSLYREWSYFVS